MQTCFAVALFVATFFSLEGAVHVMDFNNATSILSKILNNYDKNIIPIQNGKAVPVTVQIFISDMVPLTTLHMHYSMDFFLRQEWNDSRLAFNSSDEKAVLILSGDMRNKIWVPDLYFPNGKELRQYEATTPNRAMHIYGTGKIFSSERLSVTSFCPMDLAYFPFDVQICYFTIGSYAYESQFLDLKWRSQDPILKSNPKAPLYMKQFKDVEYTSDESLELFKDIGNMDGGFPTLKIKFKFYRDIQGHIFREYVPGILTVILSWISFWIDYRSSPSRVALGVTTVLTMVTLSNTMHFKLHAGSVFRSYDLYMLVCNVYVFGVVIEFAVVYLKKPKMKWKSCRMKRENKNSEGRADATMLSKKNRYDTSSENIFIRKSLTSSIFVKRHCKDKNSHNCDNLEAGRLVNDDGGEPKIKGYDKEKTYPNTHPIDRRCRYLFPISFIFLNAGYFAFHALMLGRE